MAEGAAPRLLLVGMMGSGKTTVGRLLAARLGWPYRDSDEMVQAATGHSVQELWLRRGEQSFRAEERRVLVEALDAPGPAVVAVAGGAVLDPDNRARLAGAGTVVWLRADPATLVDRIATHPGHRPLLADDPAGALLELDAARRPLYEQLADVIVDVDGRRPDQVADEVLAAAPVGG